MKFRKIRKQGADYKLTKHFLHYYSKLLVTIIYYYYYYYYEIFFLKVSFLQH